jgi:hypothetical protein
MESRMLFLFKTRSLGELVGHFGVRKNMRLLSLLGLLECWIMTEMAKWTTKNGWLSAIQQKEIGGCERLPISGWVVVSGRNNSNNNAVDRWVGCYYTKGITKTASQG